MGFFNKTKRSPSASSTGTATSNSPLTTPSRNVTFADGSPLRKQDSSGFCSPDTEDSERMARDAEARQRLSQTIKDRERNRLLQRHLMQIPKNIFLRRHDLNVAVCTWNVAEAGAQRVSQLEGWLQAKRGADIIAIGLQEVDMSAVALATSSTGKADPWVDCLSRHLIPFNFRKLTSVSLVGILIAVFVKVDLLPSVDHLVVREVKLGTGGFTANKGALAVGFTLHCKRLLFVTSHFMAHQENTDKRNENFHIVLNHLTQHDALPQEASADPCHDLVVFGTTGEVGQRSRRSSSVEKGIFGSPKSGQQATVANSLLGTVDYVFWFGDLNYRVESSYEEVMQAIAHKNPAAILKGDQLVREQAAGRVFNDFTEAPIGFLPTYKYVKGEAIYDTSKKGGKRRVPAYTDRVLYYTLRSQQPDDFLPRRSNMVLPMKYKAYHHTLSDHHPVCCLFQVATYRTDPQALDRVVDLGGAGMSPQQITSTLKEQLDVPRDEDALYAPAPVPKPDVKGPGTVYSSDEEDENTADQRQRKRLEDRLEALENLLTRGPLPGEHTLDEIKSGQHGLSHKVTDLTNRLATLPVAPQEEINLLGESMTHVLDRLHSVEGMLTSAADGPLGSSVQNLKTQLASLTGRVDVFLTTVAASGSGGLLDPESAIPPQYRDEPGLDDGEKQRRAELRAVFLAGVAAGAKSRGGVSSLDPNSPAYEELMEERQAALAQRELDMKHIISLREAECERREKQLVAREVELQSRSEALQKLQAVLEERVKASEALKHTEATAADNLQRREEELRENELRLLQQRAKLSSQQLRLKQEIADLEANRETFSSQLNYREQLLTQRDLQLTGEEELLEGKLGWLEEEEEASPKPAWRGVLEGPASSMSPGRLRGTYSPVSDLARLDLLPSSRAVTVSRDPSPLRLPRSITPPRRRKAPPADPLAAALLPSAHDARLPSNFARICLDSNYPDAYIYLFGTRKVTIRLMGEAKKEPRVLIGSGWMPFSAFVSKFGDPEQRRLIRSQQSA